MVQTEVKTMHLGEENQKYIFIEKKKPPFSIFKILKINYKKRIINKI